MQIDCLDKGACCHVHAHVIICVVPINLRLLFIKQVLRLVEFTDCSANIQKCLKCAPGGSLGRVLACGSGLIMGVDAVLLGGPPPGRKPPR